MTTVEFVTIKPAMLPDGQTPMRVPMPGGLGLPGIGFPLPAAGARVPSSEFVRRLIADGDVVVVPEPAEPAAVTASVPAASGGTAPAANTVSAGGTVSATSNGSSAR